ncbi:MAG: ATP-binding cassette domain-containing protein [Pseudanabaenaceae cyanobacterium bins.39]|nr:ATP-binding cassette domain-containing protein [Pseudanabaenaceae cyanobacterium bins.39]
MQKVSAKSSIVSDRHAISTHRVSYYTKFRSLLQNISLTIAQGSKTGLIGATGSGKTTFLRLLNRLIDPNDGQISLCIQGKCSLIGEIPIQTLRRQVMLVPQEPSLLGMAVKDAIAYPLQLQNLTPAAIQERLEVWIDRLQIDRQWLNRKELELSLGQRQWIAIARALVLQPEILLLDEPTSALDRGLSHLLLEVLADLAQGTNPTTIVMINHQLELVQGWCDQLVCFADGLLVGDMTPEQIDWNAIEQMLKRDRTTIDSF